MHANMPLSLGPRWLNNPHTSAFSPGTSPAPNRGVWDRWNRLIFNVMDVDGIIFDVRVKSVIVEQDSTSFEMGNF